MITKEQASDLKSHVGCRIQAALALQSAERADVKASAVLEDFIWRLEFDKESEKP